MLAVATRLRHVYFGEDGTARPMSQARFDRVFNSHTREAIPELAGHRIRFLTLYVWFEDGIPIEISRAEGSLITFDDEGCRDQDDADLERRAAVGLLDSIGGAPEQPSVIPAAARFQSAGFRWQPSKADIETAIAIHRLRHDPR